MSAVDDKTVKSVQQQMEAELKRSMKGLRLAKNPRPFFMSYLLHHTLGLDVWGRYGAVFHTEPIRSCDLYVECRVGSYRLDQTVDGGLNDDPEDRDSYNWLVGPQDLDANVVRYAFWKLSQLKYQEALQDYYEKRKILVDQRLKSTAVSLSREDKLIKNVSVRPITFSTRRWESFVRDASALFKKYKKLLDPYVRIRGSSRVRTFVNSEGSKFTCQETYFEVIINAWYMTDEGAYLNAARYFHVRDASELPKKSTIEATIDEIARDLSILAKAQPLEPYAGPAVLSGMATGLLFHEAIGHRLEGERMLSRSEGQTFARKVGKRILPEQVDLIDDPTLAEWDGQPLFGHYEVDDEGVPAQRVELIKKGVLRSFLLSRSVAPGFKRSNGHGRHERYQDPMARMANLIIQAEDQYSWDELKAQMLEQVRLRKLPYGIIVRRVSSGETRTDDYEFQAFKGVPTEVYAVDPKTEKERRVRDVNFIGTPLAAIQRIRSFGCDYEVDNSYCYAESGSVPVSTIAPAMVVDELELQRSPGRLYRSSVLSAPPMGPR